MISFTENPKFKNDFLAGLDDTGLIELKEKDFLGIPNMPHFLDFGYGIFLLWIHASRRARNLRAYFSKLDENHTLLVISPFNNNPYFSVPPDYLPGQFYIDDIRRNYHTISSHNCKFCDLVNSIFLNVGHLKQTRAFGSFLDTDVLREISNRVKARPPCPSCKEWIFKWIRQSIVKDERFGLVLGGYPTLLKVPHRSFQFLFTVPLEEEMPRTLGNLFDYFLTTLIASELNSNVFSANSCIKTPFHSYEIDCGVYAKGKGLFVIETSSGPHNLDGLKNKFLTYSALMGINGLSKLIYLYVTLASKPSVHLRERGSKVLTGEDKDVGTLYGILGSKSFEFLSLSEGIDLDAVLRGDWWDNNILRQAFKRLIGKIQDFCNFLRVE